MVNKEKSRIDIIGQNGNTGEHYEEVEEAMPNGRWNWYGEGEDEPVWKEDKVGGKAANLREAMWQVHDQNEAARKKMNHNAYEGKFWIYEEKRFGTWEESQEFYRKQHEEEKRIRATSVANSLSKEELSAVRDRLVAEG